MIYIKPYTKKKVFDCLIQINHNDDQLLSCLDLCRLENKHFSFHSISLLTGNQ